MHPDRIETLEIVGVRPRTHGVRLGKVVDISRDGRALVDYPGNPYGPLATRRTASIPLPMIHAAHREQLAVLLVFENHDPGLPVVFDVLADSPSCADAPDARHAIREQPEEPRTQPTLPAAFARVGRIVSLCEGQLLVDFEGNRHGPQPAATTVALRNLKDEVLIVQAGGRFVIVGQLYGTVPVAANSGDAGELVLRGKSIRIEAEDEVVMAAGASRVHLDARGKAETTADHIVSRARTVNKVQGGCVKLN